MSHAKLQILFIDTVGSRGGAERSMFELAAALSGMSVDVAAVLPNGDAAEWFREAGIKVYPCKFVRLHKPSIFHPFRDTGLFTLRSVRDNIQTAANDFFKTDSSQYLIANNFAAILAVDEFRVQGSGSRVPDGEDGGRNSRTDNTSTLKTVWHVRDFPPKWQIGIGVRKADYLFAISKPVFKLLCESVPDKYRHKIRLVENGIDTTRFIKETGAASFRNAHSIPENSRIVTMAANLVPWKRHDMFIEIAGILAKKYEDTRFVIAGSDLFDEHKSYVAKLKTMADKNCPDGRILFLGNTCNMEELLRSTTVLVHTTPSEPFGRVICEAMACGAPVIASAEGGPASVITDGETGILVDGNNPQDWAEAISKLLDSDSARQSLASAAAKHIPDIRMTAECICEITRQ